MATQKIAMGINLRKNKNERSAGYGKYYPTVDRQSTLSLRGFCDHMVSHGSAFKRNVIEGVLKEIVDHLPELVAQGVPVQLEGLGTFYPTAQVVKGAGIASVAEMVGLSPNDVVKAIHIRFLPDSTKLDNLCGPAFKNACTLEFRNIIDTKEVTIDGKPRTVQILTPIATAVADYMAGQEGNGGSGNGSGSGNNGGSSAGSDSVAAPTISGTTPFAETTQVSISASDDARVYYTTDGSTPTSASTLYTQPFTLSATTTVKAIAVKDSISSSVSTKLFTKSGGSGNEGPEGE
jgi:nucleoid DNA-binding protein